MLAHQPIQLHRRGAQWKSRFHTSSSIVGQNQIFLHESSTKPASVAATRRNTFNDTRDGIVSVGAPAASRGSVQHTRQYFGVHAQTRSLRANKNKMKTKMMTENETVDSPKRGLHWCQSFELQATSCCTAWQLHQSQQGRNAQPSCPCAQKQPNFSKATRDFDACDSIESASRLKTKSPERRRHPASHHQP